MVGCGGSLCTGCCCCCCLKLTYSLQGRQRNMVMYQAPRSTWCREYLLLRGTETTDVQPAGARRRGCTCNRALDTTHHRRLSILVLHRPASAATAAPVFASSCKACCLPLLPLHLFHCWAGGCTHCSCCSFSTSEHPNLIPRHPASTPQRPSLTAERPASTSNRPSSTPECHHRSCLGSNPKHIILAQTSFDNIL